MVALGARVGYYGRAGYKRRLPIQDQRPVIPRYVLGAGCLLTIYAGASQLLYHEFDDSPAAERAFCRFGVCDTDTALAVLRGTDPDAPAPIESLVDYVKRDPAAPWRWEELAAALQKAGRIDAARYCLFRAVALAPNSPPTLLHAASFQFDQGQRPAALDLVSRGIGAGSAYDDDIFTVLEGKRVPVADILHNGLPDRRSAQAYLRRLLRSDRVADVDRVWEWMIAHGNADDKLANEYTEFRLRANQPDAAAKGWAQYARTKSPEYPDANRIFNGDFESNPTGNRFDWRLEPREGTAVDFDDTLRASGARSLRIRFDGTQNVGEIGVGETVFLPPGRYRFQASVRTQDISTDQGVAFRLTSEDGPQTLNVTTDDRRGTSEWTLVERVFDVPQSGLARVSIVRKPSLKFDNLIGGTAWIDGVKLTLDGGLN